MAQMVVRNISEQVMEQIRTLAQAERVSVEEFARRTLTAAAEEGARWRDFVRWAQRNLEHQAPARGRKRGPSSAQLIRADRDR